MASGAFSRPDPGPVRATRTVPPAPVPTGAGGRLLASGGATEEPGYQGLHGRPDDRPRRESSPCGDQPIKGVSYEVLGFSYGIIPASRRIPNGVFLKSGHVPDPTSAKPVMAEVQRVFDVPLHFIAIRPDYFFIRYDTFPIYYPFNSSLAPDLWTIVKQPATSCVDYGSERGISCYPR